MTTNKLMKSPIRALLRVLPLALALSGIGQAPAMAQTVQNLNLTNVPPDLIPEEAGAHTTAAPTEVDLGQVPTSSNGRAPTHSRAPAGGTAQQAARSARSPTVASAAAAAPSAKSVRPARAQASAGIERAVFERVPVRVALPVGKERLVTLPAVAALHVPTDIESVARIEVIDRTMYVTALLPFVPLRIVAELVDDGTQIPLDLVASPATAGATSELQVFLSGKPGNAGPGATDAQEPAEEKPLPAADMVQLTRHAAQMIYAPRRLIQPTAAIQQVPVAQDVVSGLLRGALVETAPLGQWRSGNLFVTAVRVTNLSAHPYEIALEQMRGRWIAATTQHGRLGPKGSDRDTTAVYLVCDRSFEACL
ncbi:TIGR03749 family integrating conjugative element protein [Hydrogenophaga atypica]|uniref:TIGR03749 family integrating conjugative element protein n=1 Tax=Hydrogenophaga atypica TaxID=249409 RepID=A0ABW2QMQ1_9BURK